MNQKGTIGKLVMVFLVILAVILVREYWPFTRNEQVDTYTKQWKKMEADKVASITITKDDKTLTLNKDGANWTVEKYQADSEAITNWLKSLIKPESPELISENKETQKKLGFEDKAKKLTLKNGENQVINLEMGNVSGTGRYLRFEGDNKAYLISGLPSTLDSVEVKDWVNKTLTKWEQKDLQKIILERGKNRAVLTQNEGKWFIEGKTYEIETTPLTAMFTTLENLTTTGLAEKQQEILKAPEVKVTVTTKDGDTLLQFYPAETEQYWVTSSTREGKYLISKTSVDTLKVDPTTLNPKPSATPTPAPSGK